MRLSISLARVLHLHAFPPTYLDLQEVLRNAINLLKALCVRICACAREPSRHELSLSLSLVVLALLRRGGRLGWCWFGSGIDALHCGWCGRESEYCRVDWYFVRVVCAGSLLLYVGRNGTV